MQLDTLHVILLTLLLVGCCFQAAVLLWLFMRESHYQAASKEALSWYEDHHKSLNVLNKEVSQVLMEVTQAMGAAIKSVETANAVSKETQYALISAFNAFESRINVILARLEHPTVNVSNHNIDGNVRQAAGRIDNEPKQ